MILRTFSFALATYESWLTGAELSRRRRDVTISMTAPAATPAIHSPRVIGWNLGTPFVHAIAATGAAPWHTRRRTAAGCPWTRTHGIITGMMPAADPTLHGDREQRDGQSDEHHHVDLGGRRCSHAAPGLEQL